MATPDIPAFSLHPISTRSEGVLGYFVDSTACANVEDLVSQSSYTDPEIELQKIAGYLAASDAPEISISIHGYATSSADAKARFRQIYDYAIQVCKPKDHVFFGFVWPSEQPFQGPGQTRFWGSLRLALQALPTALIGNFTGALVLGITTLLLSLGLLPTTLAWLIGIGLMAGFVTFLLLWLGKAAKLLSLLPFVIAAGAIALTVLADQAWGRLLLPILLMGLVLGFSLIFTLVALRLVTYFRDQYRATNYAVADLVELIRQLDQKLLEASQAGRSAVPEWILEGEPLPEAKANYRYRVKLNFLSHSMGCFVTTNAVRILSDVFDPVAVAKNPTSKLGKTLSLERLILAAPDISAEAAMPGHMNILKASLRRCTEAYIFSNEGDLALRLASTAANYFSFPARTRFRGYRLGNLTVKHFQDQTQHQNFTLKSDQYGIRNLDAGQSQVLDPYKFLELRASVQEHRNLVELNEPVEENSNLDSNSIVNRFTVFDCTDYRDYKLPIGAPTQGQPIVPILSRAVSKSALNWINYFRLSIDSFLGHRVNTHGGYFEGKFSQRLMYELLFLGFNRFLLTYDQATALTERNSKPLRQLTTVQKQQQMLLAFSNDCRDKSLQVVLSPLRWSQTESDLSPRRQGDTPSTDAEARTKVE